MWLCNRLQPFLLSGQKAGVNPLHLRRMEYNALETEKNVFLSNNWNLIWKTKTDIFLNHW
ncbi:MAG: hypothetical protein CSA33_05950 [Desulfobulbus propionicus]|nr:MAG: hypothetical protein CSA33_05950 [Desulfobulbus propionicus]